MNQEERLEFLIRYLHNEKTELKDINIPKNFEDKKDLFRALCNVRLPQRIDESFLKLQDEFLKTEVKRKGITDIKSLKPIDKNIYLWKGDITTLKVHAIVNAGNNKLLGCFIPLHKCIDNAIHSFAGIALRNECNYIMIDQGEDEKNGKVKITSGYNLPCKYILHTVGPIVYGNLTKENIEDLKRCYKECLKVSDRNGIKSIAFCCISTGEFRFPNLEAGEIAINTVKEYLDKTNSKIEVIFNVYKEIDYQIYKRILSES